MMKKNPINLKKYISVASVQGNKNQARVCGDFVSCDRTDEATTIILCDGIGSGIKANVAAVMCASRLLELIRLGFSLRQACAKLVDTMHEARSADIPFSAFSVCRILNDGHVTMISYEMPAAVIAEKFRAYIPKQRFSRLGAEVISESNCFLEPGEGIFLFSDGVAQAGMGSVFKTGWGAEGAANYVNACIDTRVALKDIPEKILERVKYYSGPSYGDDTTILFISCRQARPLQVLTGPPSDRAQDRGIMERFMALNGPKVVCGSTTADVLARYLGAQVKLRGVSEAYYKPPQYEIKGIDLVTEGVITLNQVYNILEENPENLDNESCVSQLCVLLRDADAVNLMVGAASNPGHHNIVFRQMGLLPRQVIVQLLSEKLKKMGKLVTIEYV